MKNNKGFAISLMLYAMILLIVTIFYIVLAIVKTRFTYSEAMVNSAIKFLDEHDASMGHGDRTGPLILFSPLSSGFSNGGIINVSIFDDQDGEGLKKDSIIIKIVNVSVDPIVENVIYSNEIIHFPNYITISQNGKYYFQASVKIPNNAGEYILYVSAKDGKDNFAQTLPRRTENDNNTYSYQKYAVTDTGPHCTVNNPKLLTYRTIDDGDNNSSNDKVVIDKYVQLSKNEEIKSYSTIQYEIICTGKNGIDAYINREDFKYTRDSSDTSVPNSNNSHIYVNNITILNGINESRITIQAQAFYIPKSTDIDDGAGYTPFGCSDPLTLELKDPSNTTIMDSIGNAAKLDFSNTTVKVCLKEDSLGVDPTT